MSIGREPSPMKKKRSESISNKSRSDSISGRLRSASELFELGFIEKEDMGSLKEMIIRQDERTDEALARARAGEKKVYREILNSSMGLDDPYGMDSLYQSFSNFGGSGSLGSNPSKDVQDHLFSFENDGAPFVQDADREEPLLKPEGGLFSLDIEENVSEHSKYRVHADSIAAINDMPLDIYDHDDMRDDYIFGQDQSVTASSPVQIPGIDRGGDIQYMNNREPERKFDASSYMKHSRQKPAAQRKPKKKTQKKSQGTSRRKETKKTKNIDNGSMTTTENTFAPSEPLETPPELIDRAGVNGKIGSYLPPARRELLQKFLEKRQKRTWKKKVKYDVRKNFADSRLRVKGRFVKKEDEETLREFMLMTI